VNALTQVPLSRGKAPEFLLGFHCFGKFSLGLGQYSATTLSPDNGSSRWWQVTASGGGKPQASALRTLSVGGLAETLGFLPSQLYLNFIVCGLPAVFLSTGTFL
jgi:hypothetical protein